ncbi:hypothetical protein L596_011149 [Steinernema carpocapsae]|uniref:Abnormal cell migration protein 18-like fibronectin type I domain-containing protein n=1 Tax=Steinernema carpocapsae TaxID=34508 RepID=A0A4U5NTH7_STECR|nr:hypothetical protein L596_011149 [Steinernema carpocapsae]
MLCQLFFERHFVLPLLVVFFGASLSEASVCRYQKGTQQNGDKWLEKNLFVMQCKVESNGAWKVEVVGCRLPSGTDVPLNGSVEENDSQWNCTVGADGSISLQQGSTKCDGHDIGSRWVEKAFELECAPGRSSALSDASATMAPRFLLTARFSRTVSTSHASSLSMALSSSTAPRR